MCQACETWVHIPAPNRTTLLMVYLCLVWATNTHLQTSFWKLSYLSSCFSLLPGSSSLKTLHNVFRDGFVSGTFIYIYNFFCSSLTSHLYWLLATFHSFPPFIIYCYFISSCCLPPQLNEGGLLPRFSAWHQSVCGDAETISRHPDQYCLLISCFLPFLLVSLSVSSYCHLFRQKAF